MIAANRTALAEVLDRYGASNPHAFGSVARGDASRNSDVDLLVDLEPGGGNPLLRVAGIGQELGSILGVRVDVVEETLLRASVSTTALRDAVAL
ncbi:MAG: nucleotidyltransferase domain-containing protein [Bifidobacteriaceae bacterium]|jgi:predicted nucleotidyltransferase|nr:nucleotidyltransferase domain-containing protein [Bifidobacteriaceae bacterium]